MFFYIDIFLDLEKLHVEELLLLHKNDTTKLKISYGGDFLSSVDAEVGEKHKEEELLLRTFFGTSFQLQM